jgi:superfamily II DNA or RNA helicase
VTYDAFLARKAYAAPPVGLTEVPTLNAALFPYQSDIVAWALRRGRAAVFADCGMGKTLMQLEWARHVPGKVIILTPLAVAAQTAAEAVRFGIDAAVSRDGSVTGQITIANYEILHKFDCSQFAGVVLDESSILKAYDSKTRTAIIDAFGRTPFRLACTATPAPNDHVELGNHAEFLGVMLRQEMLATFFCHDGGETQVWRLKGHAEDDFWRWVASWAAMVRRPSDLGYSDDGFTLPTLTVHEHIMPSGVKQEGSLFAVSADTLADQRAARKATMHARVARVAELVAAETDEPWLIWCELNAEGDALADSIAGAVQVAGADSEDAKESRMLGFSGGAHRVLVTKPSIAGFGMNWQHCARMAFVGLSHSYEQFYQAVRRCWRFGQSRDVHVHVVTTDVEEAVLRNIKRKQKDHDVMASSMVDHMTDTMRREISGTSRQTTAYSARNEMKIPSWIGREDA